MKNGKRWETCRYAVELDPVSERALELEGLGLHGSYCCGCRDVIKSGKYQSVDVSIHDKNMALYAQLYEVHDAAGITKKRLGKIRKDIKGALRDCESCKHYEHNPVMPSEHSSDVEMEYMEDDGKKLNPGDTNAMPQKSPGPAAIIGEQSFEKCAHSLTKPFSGEMLEVYLQRGLSERYACGNTRVLEGSARRTTVNDNGMRKVAALMHDISDEDLRAEDAAKRSGKEYESIESGLGKALEVCRTCKSYRMKREGPKDVSPKFDGIADADFESTQNER